jgi:hypothetical protein
VAGRRSVGENGRHEKKQCKLRMILEAKQGGKGEKCRHSIWLLQ